MDASGFAQLFASDGTLRFANRPPTTGRAAVEAAMRDFFSALGGLAHQVDETWEKPSSLVVEGRAIYLRKDGGRVMLPFTNVLVLRGDEIADLRIYIDVAPVFPAARAA